MRETPKVAGRAVGAIGALHVALALAYAVVSAAPALRDRLPAGVPPALSVLLHVLTTALLVRRAVRDPRDRAAWALVALGFACYTAGTVYSCVATWGGAPLGFPSPADLGWLAAYPFMFLGILGFLRARTATGVTLLDGAVAGVGGAALFSTVVVDLLSGRGTQPGDLAGVVSMAYPLVDALMAGGLLCQFAIGTWRGRRDLIAFTVGIVLLTVTDTGYVLSGGYQPDTVVDVGYALVMGVIGVSALMPRRVCAEGSRPAAVRVGLAGAAAATALGVLLAASRVHLSFPSVGLAGLALILVVARFQVSLGELKAVGDARHSEARRDPLTGLANRRGFTEHFDHFRLAPDQRVVALLLDLDRFKQVNDSFGHQAGDELLRQAADRLRAVTRAGDLLARLGGDEFVLVGAIDDAALTALAQRIRQTVRHPFDIAGIPIEIDVSIGIATAAGEAATADALLRHADIAMYTAKRSGGGHAFYRERDDEAARLHLELAQDLRADVTTAAMVLHYQPKLDLRTDAVSAVEALVRWQHPTRGLLYPDAFLPLVEETGLMPDLTRNVLTQAMDQCAAWRSADLRIAVAVNVTAIDLELPGFVDLVVDVLRDRALPANALTLEITETTAMENSERAHRTVRELHRLGIRVSIDDYGTDHSTLSHLHRLLVAGELKLDRRFVTHLETEERSSVIVRSSIQLAHALGMAVVAEGVENAQALDMLREWGCDTAQGYFISRPQPAEDVTAWLTGAGTSRQRTASRPPAAVGTAPLPVPPLTAR